MNIYILDCNVDKKKSSFGNNVINENCKWFNQYRQNPIPINEYIYIYIKVGLKKILQSCHFNVRFFVKFKLRLIVNFRIRIMGLN